MYARPGRPRPARWTAPASPGTAHRRLTPRVKIRLKGWRRYALKPN